MVVISLLFGVMLVTPIGGADMPTVIALLNSYVGLTAALLGFVLNSKVLVVAGALDGSSGFILAVVMCKAMNRSFTNVLFGAFGQLQVSAKAAQEERTVHTATPEEAAAILASANTVLIVPGYGMAVAQAQHKVRELLDVLAKKGVDVKFGIHPVAGRMPGHMNVLLAEADVPYDKLVEMDAANSEMPQTDVALVIGANDVTNPAAKTDQGSPIYGMPIIEVDQRPDGDGDQAQPESRVRGHRQPALLHRQDHDAVRRREGVRQQHRQGADRRRGVGMTHAEGGEQVGGCRSVARRTVARGCEIRAFRVSKGPGSTQSRGRFSPSPAVIP